MKCLSPTVICNTKEQSWAFPEKFYGCVPKTTMRNHYTGALRRRIVVHCSDWRRRRANAYAVTDRPGVHRLRAALSMFTPAYPPPP